MIIGFFIFAGILTVGVDTQDNEDDENYWKEHVERVKAIGKEETDGDGNAASSSKEEKDPMEELDELVGLQSVKEEVASLVNLIKVQKAREAQGFKTPDISYHLVFSGNPGTGKTTVARILARIYRDIGILKKGHMVETDRSGMIGEYVGTTAPKVNHICDSALGGVLFIDEAYAITQDKGANHDYGAEAVATLLKRMEDDRESLIVIVAGYTDEMKDFIDANPGLKSRFTRFIEFPDYSGDELSQIYMMRINKYGFSMTEEAKATLQQLMAHAVATKDRNFGNGRYARNLFENTISAQANRLGKEDVSSMSKKELNTIEKQDVENAYQQTKR